MSRVNVSAEPFNTGMFLLNALDVFTRSSTKRKNMSILGNIFGKIFPSRSKTNEQAPATQTAQNAGTPAGDSATTQASPAPASPAASPAPTQAAAIEEVDVERILNDMAAKNPQKLNWRTSIVDLMKLLDLDSSLAARKELAKELNYTGDTSDSASMNIWLHKQVMNKLAENGGKVPADLKD
jgi:hypothetical protein